MRLSTTSNEEKFSGWFIRWKAYGLMLLLAVSCIGTGWTSDIEDQSANQVLQQTRVDEYLQTEESIRIFRSALQSSRYWSDVKAAEEITLFVPTDDALRAEGSAFLLELVLQKSENKERLDDVMGYHIVASTFRLSPQTSELEFVKTVNGVCIEVSALSNALKIGPEAVLKKSVRADNGMVYIIDRLMWAPYEHSQSVKGCE